MKVRIHINQHRIRANTKWGTRDPVVSVKRSGLPTEYGHSVVIKGPSEVIYRPEKPLSCGARVWIETESEVEVR